jgi:hypothetical protein
MNHSCFAPPTRLLIGTREFEVRELAWPEALEFFRRLGAATTSLLTAEGKPRPTADFLPELITQAGSAVSFLLQHSVGMSADDLQSLPGTAVVRLTQSALELTLNEELIAAGKAVAERLRRAFGPPTPSRMPSTT